MNYGLRIVESAFAEASAFAPLGLCRDKSARQGAPVFAALRLGRRSLFEMFVRVVLRLLDWELVNVFTDIGV